MNQKNLTSRHQKWIWFIVNLVVTLILTTSAAFAEGELFGSRVDIATGSWPAVVTTGDFNGDGKQDMAVANKGSISILLGNGDGSFQSQVDYVIGNWICAINVNDFNNDGKADLAIADASGYESVSIFIGNGDGSFQLNASYSIAGPYTIGGIASAIVSGDFNGDRNEDMIVTSNLDYGSISVFMGNGDGTFSPKVDYSWGTGVLYQPSSIAISDFNGDGKLDLAITNINCIVSILIGSGDGTFQPSIYTNITGQYPRSIVVGDFNGDGKADFATVNYDYWVQWFGATALSVFIGNGDGTFQPRVDYDIGWKPYSIGIGDFNKDGKIDLVATSFYHYWSGRSYIYGNNVVSTFIGNGDGTFQPKIDYSSGNGPVSVSAGDFNNDNKMDLIVANSGSNTVSVLLNIYNRPPVPNAGPNQFIECSGPSGTSVTLDASGSSDPDGDPLNYIWTWNGGSAEGVNPTVSLPLGTTVVMLTVSDGKATSSDAVNITVSDTNPPVTVATGGSESWYNMNVISTFTAFDSGSGIKEVHYNINGSETITAGNYASASLFDDGIYNIAYFATDNAGNTESAKTMTVKIDKTPPSGSILINSDAIMTNTTAVTLDLSASDNLSGVSQMRLSNDNITWSIWEPYTPTKSWILSSADPMTIYAQVRDAAGNMSDIYSDTIYLDSDIPSDGIHDSIDNCPSVSNPDQSDRNWNGIGDACDGDLDGDTVVDTRDNCPAAYNPGQSDSDGDGIGDDCDACINDPQNNCLNSSSQISADITEPVTVSNAAETASVTIEPGDLSTDTLITVTGQTSTSNFAWGSNQQVAGAIYTFTATPTSNFNAPVTIVLKYDQGTMPEGKVTEQNLDIYYYDTANQVWVAQGAAQDMLNNTLTLEISHFSSYAVIATENQISDLAAAFRGINIEDRTEWANLLDRINRAYDNYERGDIEAAKNDLKVFINKLESESRQKIDEASANMLIQFAMEILGKL